MSLTRRLTDHVEDWEPPYFLLIAAWLTTSISVGIATNSVWWGIATAGVIFLLEEFLSDYTRRICNAIKEVSRE